MDELEQKVWDNVLRLVSDSIQANIAGGCRAIVLDNVWENIWNNVKTNIEEELKDE